ncbi:CTAG/Pcc1 family, partial [Lentinula aciculospora]
TRTLKIPFAVEKHALIAKRTIEVDPELQPHVVKRTISVEENILIAYFSTLTIRLARLAANAFLENVDLVVRTLEQFGEEAGNYSSS